MDQKLELILDGVLNLFKKHGIRIISMDEIARSLSISKKTLYLYFENKDDLIKKSFEYIIDKTSHDKINNDKTLNAVDVLLEISRIVREETDEINPLVVFDLHKYYPAIYQSILMKKRDQILNEISLNFQRGINEGIYRTDIDIDLVARFYVKGLMEMHDPEFIKAPFGKIFQVMFDSHIRSIVNEKGLAYYENKIKPLTQ